MTDHILKCHKKNFVDITEGQRLFDVRNDDRGYQKGDVVTFREYDSENGKYTGRWIDVIITRVADSTELSRWLQRGVTGGMVAFGFKPIRHQSNTKSTERVFDDE